MDGNNNNFDNLVLWNGSSDNHFISAPLKLAVRRWVEKSDVRFENLPKNCTINNLKLLKMNKCLLKFWSWCQNSYLFMYDKFAFHAYSCLILWKKNGTIRNNTHFFPLFLEREMTFNSTFYCLSWIFSKCDFTKYLQNPCEGE